MGQVNNLPRISLNLPWCAMMCHDVIEVLGVALYSWKLRKTIFNRILNSNFDNNKNEKIIWPPNSSCPRLPYVCMLYGCVMCRHMFTMVDLPSGHNNINVTICTLHILVYMCNCVSAAYMCTKLILMKFTKLY